VDHKSSLNSIGYRGEDERIRRHLQRAERRLRACDSSALPREVQIARARSLDHLHAYIVRGEFPRNTDTAFTRTPCFIDHENRACAVAHLIIASGQRDLAARVDQIAHNARIRKMRLKELDRWAQQSGLTRDELALIQPGYDPVAWMVLYGVVVVPILLGISAVSFVLTRMNNSTLRSRASGIRAWLPALLSLLSVGAVLFLYPGVVQFLADMVMYFFGIIDVSDLARRGYYMPQPASQLAMAIPLLVWITVAVGALIMVGQSAISGGRVLMKVRVQDPKPAIE
jgi:hypothetical protein